MAILFAPPRFKATDKENAPISGAFLQFFQFQTSTLQPIYTDSTLQIPLLNPLKADANGLFPEIWLDDSLPPYKVVFSSPDTNDPTLPGAIIWSIQQYNASLSVDALTPLLNPLTAAEIAAGVIPTNYAYAPGVVNRYGININPGTTDMTAAIQAAINQAQQTNGSPAQLLGQTYLITSTLKITANWTRLQGLGRGRSSIACNTSGAGSVILVNNPGSAIFGVQIQDLAINCQAGLSQPPNGITFKDASECYVERCFSANHHDGIIFNGVDIMRVVDFESGGASTVGIYFTINGTSVFTSNDMVWLENLNLFNTSIAGILIGGFTNDVQVNSSYSEESPWAVLISNDSGVNVLVDKLELNGLTSWNNASNSFTGTGYLGVSAPSGSANYLQTRNLVVNRAKSFQNKGSSYHIQISQNGNTHANTAHFGLQIRDGEYYSASTAVVFSDATICFGDIRGSVTALNGYQTGSAIALRAGAGTSSSTGTNIWGTEESGTFTPTDASGAALTFSNVLGRWTRRGTRVTATIQLTYPTITNSSQATIGGLPFKSISTTGNIFGGTANFSSAALNIGALIAQNDSKLLLYQINGGSAVTNTQMSANSIVMTVTYESQ